MSRVLVLDTETTDVKEPQAVEVAWLEIDEKLNVINQFEQRYKPSKKISFGAMAIHGITEGDVFGCPPHDSFELPQGTEYIIGHNVDFDWRVIGAPSVKRIDTLKVARSQWPGMDSYTLGAMIFYLYGQQAKEMVRNAHSALADCHLCLKLLKAAYDRMGKPSFEALHSGSDPSKMPTILEFGKHKGMAIGDVPASYRRWLLEQTGIAPALVAAIKLSLAPTNNASLFGKK